MYDFKRSSYMLYSWKTYLNIKSPFWQNDQKYNMVKTMILQCIWMGIPQELQIFNWPEQIFYHRWHVPFNLVIPQAFLVYKTLA